MDPDVAKLAQVMVVIGAFGGFVTVMWLIVRVVLRATGDKPRGALPAVDDARFTRLEQSVESIAVEVERIAESQRFQAKLMSERAGERAGVPVLRDPRGQ